jgi:hypothetical protein
MIDRRLFISLISAAAAAPAAFSQQAGAPMLKRARTSVLEIAYEESGPETGFPVLLMHGFPYDPRAFDAKPIRRAPASRRRWDAISSS